jgi:hypothetical protein
MIPLGYHLKRAASYRISVNEKCLICPVIAKQGQAIRYYQW